MMPGIRQHKSASLRVAIPEGMPEDLSSQLRELLSVKSEFKRNGEATALMYQVTSEADFAWMVLFLHVKPFEDGITEEQLIKFYRKFGFEVVQTDPVLLMSRLPARPKLARVN